MNMDPLSGAITPAAPRGNLNHEIHVKQVEQYECEINTKRRLKRQKAKAERNERNGG